ncbi:prolyl 4-hydroxylase subunit alpha-1-like [Haemaphysalis longicornis]
MPSVWPEFFVLCLYFGSASTANDLFTSTEHLQELLASESLTLEDVSYLLLWEKGRLSKAKLLHTEWEMAAASHTDHDVLSKFLSASRFGAFWRDVLAQRSNPDDSPLRSDVLTPSSRQWWATDQDLSGAAVSICKLQQVYDIPVTRMAVMASPLIPATSPDVLVDVARGCFVKGRFGNTSAWLQAALLNAKSRGSTRRRLALGASWLEANDKRRRALIKKGLQPWHPGSPSSDVRSYKSVCVSGGDLRQARKDLVCRSSTDSVNPLLKLTPLTRELLSLEPRIVLFRDFLSRSEVTFMRHKSVRALDRGRLYVSDEQPDGVSWERISKVAWLSDTENDVLQRISRRIAAATSLSLESAEDYQVSNYGLGGHYTPHLDSAYLNDVADNLHQERGNRLATMLFFLSDVTAGGATAFVELGIAVKPRAGDALFWFDVEPYEGTDFPRDFSFWHQKRSPDFKTLHVGCPVLRGSKWIATKWIREKDNIVVNYDFPD